MLRWQMFTGAVMAKGFEDTAFYTYTALISLNEVGMRPLPRRSRYSGYKVFIEFNENRQRSLAAHDECDLDT